ncbi:MAG: flagellar hook-associated protein FlgL [Gammaproteobacteria bacterium]|nr:flagellar hook-associated protein FlgL [Gammaproteobacteria bacterium]
MRIASNVYQLQWLASIQRQQADLAAIQDQVSSGRRISTAADDPAGAAQGLLLQQGLDRLENFGTNAETARRRLALEEGSLSQATDALNRVRELAIQAANGTQTQESRSAIAAEARELLTGLLNTANAQDGEGRYLFAGNLVQTRPFVLSGNVQYAGDNGVRSQRVADARTVQEGDPGSAVFMQIPAGNGAYTISPNAGNTGTASWTSATVANGTPFVPGNYTLEFTSATTWEARSGAAVIANGTYASGETISFQGASIEFQGTPAAGDQFTVASAGFKDVFRTVQDFIGTLGTGTSNAAGRTTFQNRLNSDLQNLDQALQQISNFRSQVGARLATIDRQLDNNADVALELKSSLSTIKDLDYATAISKLEQQLTSLEAAQKAYARTQSLSLFDVL